MICTNLSYICFKKKSLPVSEIPAWIFGLNVTISIYCNCGIITAWADIFLSRPCILHRLDHAFSLKAALLSIPFYETEPQCR
jgi:hypothetical protein